MQVVAFFALVAATAFRVLEAGQAGLGAAFGRWRRGGVDGLQAEEPVGGG